MMLNANTSRDSDSYSSNKISLENNKDKQQVLDEYSKKLKNYEDEDDKVIESEIIKKNLIRKNNQKSCNYNLIKLKKNLTNKELTPYNEYGRNSGLSSYYTNLEKSPTKSGTNLFSNLLVKKIKKEENIYKSKISIPVRRNINITKSLLSNSSLVSSIPKKDILNNRYHNFKINWDLNNNIKNDNDIKNLIIKNDNNKLASINVSEHHSALKKINCINSQNNLSLSTINRTPKNTKVLSHLNSKEKEVIRNFIGRNRKLKSEIDKNNNCNCNCYSIDNNNKLNKNLQIKSTKKIEEKCKSIDDSNKTNLQNKDISTTNISCKKYVNASTSCQNFEEPEEELKSRKSLLKKLNTLKISNFLNKKTINDLPITIPLYLNYDQYYKSPSEKNRHEKNITKLIKLKTYLMNYPKNRNEIIHEFLFLNFIDDKVKYDTSQIDNFCCYLNRDFIINTGMSLIDIVNEGMNYIPSPEELQNFRENQFNKDVPNFLSDFIEKNNGLPRHSGESTIFSQKNYSLSTKIRTKIELPPIKNVVDKKLNSKYSKLINEKINSFKKGGKYFFNNDDDREELLEKLNERLHPIFDCTSNVNNYGYKPKEYFKKEKIAKYINKSNIIIRNKIGNSFKVGNIKDVKNDKIFALDIESIKRK